MVPVRRVFAYAPVLLLALLVVSPAQAACQTADSGSLLVPSVLASPPPVLPEDANQGVNVHVLRGFVPGAGYELKAVATQSSFCLPSQPCPVHVVLPDLNVGWYTASGVLTANHNGVGDEVGKIPANAVYGVVYMTTGPDWTLFDGPLSDGDARARFTFASGCS